MENNTSGNNVALEARREKFWSELTSEEKIERNRSVLKILLNKVDRIENIGYKTRKILLGHSHRDDGKVVQIVTDIETDSFDNPRGRITNKDGDNVYF